MMERDARGRIHGRWRRNIFVLTDVGLHQFVGGETMQRRTTASVPDDNHLFSGNDFPRKFNQELQQSRLHSFGRANCELPSEWGQPWMDSSIVTPPVLSPATPPRVLSSHSLLGEHIMSSSRHTIDEGTAAVLPRNLPVMPPPLDVSTTTPGYNDDCSTSTPPSSIPLHPPLSPPPPPTSSNSNSNNNLSLLEIIATSSASVASKGTHKGRPPRAPAHPFNAGQQQLAPSQQQPQRSSSTNKAFPHSRVPSSSDCSFLSALTDGSISDSDGYNNNGPPLMKPQQNHHRRKAHSWDFNMTSLEGINSSSNTGTPISILQPILNDEEEEEDDDPRNLSFSPERTEIISPIRIRGDFTPSATFGPPSIGNDSQRHNRSAFGTTACATKPILLRDVIASQPMESRGETHVLRVMEAQAGRYRSSWKQSALSHFLERQCCHPIQHFVASETTNNHVQAVFDGSESTRPSATTTTCASAAVPPSATPLSWELDNERKPISQEMESQKYILLLHRLRKSLTLSQSVQGSNYCESRQRRQRAITFVATIFVVLIALLLLDFNEPNATATVSGRGQSTSSSWLSVTLFVTTCGLAFALKSPFPIPSHAELQSWGISATVLLSQSKGWPAFVFFWGLFLFVGTTVYQTRTNRNLPLRSFAVTSMVVGILVALKRTLIGIYCGRWFVARYYNQMHLLLQHLALISEFAVWSQKIHRRVNSLGSIDKCSFDFYGTSDIFSGELCDSSNKQEMTSQPALLVGRTINDNREDPNKSFNRKVLNNLISNDSFTRGMGSKAGYIDEVPKSMRSTISQLIEAWEPEENGVVNPAQIDTSLELMQQFRVALDAIETDYPFSPAFGNIQNREQCFKVAQAAFRRLAPNSNHLNTIDFVDIIFGIARSKEGVLDQAKALELIRVFRPDRQGRLSMLDFIKSIDTVYRQMHRFKASIGQFSIMHNTCNTMLNVISYGFVAVFFLTPQIFFAMVEIGIFVSLVIVAVCASKFIEGALFIVVRQPFEIGDRIVISDVATDVDCKNRHLGWIVEAFDLFTTTVRSLNGDEVAIFTNGSLANLRIVNTALSNHAVVEIQLMFDATFTSAHKIESYQQAIERFLKSRPREWLSFLGLQPTRIVAKSNNTVEYTLTAQHWESWQSITAVRRSQTDLHCFCLELQKKIKPTSAEPASADAVVE